VKWFRSHDHWSNSDPSTQLIEVIVVDITDRKKYEEKIKAQFEEMSRIAAEKDKFFSIISHDLRSPFLGFLGYSQIIAETMNQLPINEVQKIAVKLQQSAKNLYELLDNLLNWSLIQRDNISFKPEPIQIDEFIKSVVKLMETPAAKKELEIKISIGKPLTVYADQQMLSTIARNLISNSIKFTNRKGRIEITAIESENDTVKLCFKDTGIGMSKEALDNLFRLDVKVSTPGTEGEPSTGLGLILCKEFIEKNGGELEINSEPGKGSCFSFTIPKFNKQRINLS
jgi:signal transduction histidine kinase